MSIWNGRFSVTAFAAIAALFATWVQMFFSLEDLADMGTVSFTPAVLPPMAWAISPLVFLVLVMVIRPSPKGAVLAAVIFVPVNVAAVATLIPAVHLTFRGLAGL
jgi:hypothetical protein